MAGPFSPKKSYIAAVTPVSQVIYLGDWEDDGPQLYFMNTGNANAYVRFGNASTTVANAPAVDTGMCIGPGSYGVLTIGQCTHMAVITDAGSSTTFAVTRGFGD